MPRTIRKLPKSRAAAPPIRERHHLSRRARIKSMSLWNEALARRFMVDGRLPEHHYVPLDHKTGEIRLLRFVEPLDAETGYLECSLEHVQQTAQIAPTCEPTTSPWGPYIAVSYAWGSSYFHDTERQMIRPWILLDGNLCVVRPNLFEALRQLRQLMIAGTCTIDRFWVDAICINQNDLSERNLQVRRMHDIFGEANLVYGFLATYWEAQSNVERMPIPMRIDPDLALSKLLTLAGLNLTQMESYVSNLELRHLATSNDFSAEEQSEWANLYRFFACEYWARVWIIQEIAIAREDSVFIVFGRSSIPHNGDLSTSLGNVHAMPWNTVAQAAANVELGKYPIEDLMMSYGEGKKLRKWPYWFIIRRISSLRSQRSKLSDKQTPATLHDGNGHWTIGLVRRSFARDPRDKVYGILSLLPNDIAGKITVDYEKSVAAVYTDFTAAVIESSGAIHTLPHGAPTIMDNDLPSWVPDLSNPNITRPFRTRCNVWGDVEPQSSQPRATDKTLHASGLFIDTLSTVTAAPDVADTQLALDSSAKSEHSQSPDYTATKVLLLQTLVSGLGDQRHWQRHVPSLDYILSQRSYYALYDFIATNQDFALPGNLRLLDMFCVPSGSESSIEDKAILGEIDYQLSLRKLATTAHGGLALVSPKSRPGDIVCALVGRDDLGILRQVEDRKWIWLGNAYIEGLMAGEAVKGRRHEIRQFDII